MSVSVEHKEAPFQSQTQHKLEDIMVVQDLKMHFPVTAGLLKRQVGAVKAVDGVSFSIKRGQTLGIVGESGSGKSTVGNCLLQRYKITSGDIFFEGHNLKDVTKHALRSMRKQMQMITQDPFASLDPRMDIQGAISEGMRIHHMGTAKEREDAWVKDHPTTVLIGIGGALQSGKPHDGRAPDYDDWTLNGDILLWDDLLGRAIELSSMGIRVDAAALDRQLKTAGCDSRRELTFHKLLLEDKLPLTIGGGIGQSRLSMFLLGKAHIGEVQVSTWDDETIQTCHDAGIILL